MAKDEEEIIKAMRGNLMDPGISLSVKYRILFSLRNLKDTEAHHALAEGLKDKSELFRHEVAYCMGQRCDPIAIEILSQLMDNSTEHAMVRHEAGEALGAIGTPQCLQILEKHQNDRCLEVAQTCQLAMQRIAFLNSEEGSSYREESKYLSVDPAPAFESSRPIHELQNLLIDEEAPIFERYRALFALRNIGSSEAIKALSQSFRSKSALLKHEVAYVLGQMQDKEAVNTLRRILKDESEDAMVRHEAAEALGSIADPECIQLLKESSLDSEPIVADSCIVALDMLNHELSQDWQYAIDGLSSPIKA